MKTWYGNCSSLRQNNAILNGATIVKRLTTYSFGLLIVFALLVPSTTVTAGNYSSTFWNEYQTDSIYLFLYDDNNRHDAIFQSVTFSNATWSVADQSDTYLHLSGPEAGPWDIAFTLSITDNRNRNARIIPFTLEWAEYLNGSPSAVDAMGSIEFTRGGNSWVASSDFNSTIPNPIPASTWLLLSGIGFLVGVRRQTRS